jgi:hypothetical protein
VSVCHGWIDGGLSPYDDMFWLVRFTPLSEDSSWSEINRIRVPSCVGLAEADSALASRGTWPWQSAEPSPNASLHVGRRHPCAKAAYDRFGREQLGELARVVI